MRVRRSHFNSFLRDKKYSRRGFTLVELIVVLTIIAILAAVGVVGLVGYINKSRFDENSRNAVTVYQAAQNAIAAKTAAGTADEWTRGVMQNVTHNDFTSAEIGNVTEVNDSYHKTIALTYNPRAPRSEGTEDQALYDLLSPYFYDPTVFSGTMSIELDVSVTRDSDGTDLYSARVISAYYSKQNTGNSGWDAKCTNTETAVSGRLPETDLAYRQSKSYVGYFDGTEASIAGPVSLPQDQMNSDYIFTLRNSETLDVTWGFFNNPDQNAEFDIRLHDINSTDSLGVGDVLIHIKEQTLLNSAASTLGNTRNIFECIRYESGFTAWPKLEVQEGYTQIAVKRVVAGSTSGSVTTTEEVTYVVPFSITRVTGDTRDNTPDDYYTYTISLDCLMTRASYNNVSASAYNNILLSKRLFNTDDPKNISAHLESGSMPGATISESYATRAVDDPVYFTELKLEGPSDGADQQIRYCYDISSARAGCDTADYCVVNTLFGDLECNDLDGQTISGSYAGSAGGKAVITSFRHLSNIRRIGTAPVEFKIARDLNWFNNVGNVLLSEVKVFASGGNNSFVYHSPVENGVAKIVSFPAIPKLNAGQSLSSLSTDTGDENSVIISINRVQMRKASFASNDTCYGLICDNYGTVYNIYTNNINIVAVDLADGSDSDYSKNNRNSICPTVAVSIDVDGGTRPLENYNNNDFQRPMGGLIGWNHGNVGLQGESISNGQNTIKMSNCIVMSSKYWSIYNNNSKAPAGGIIGRNENNVYGLLVVNGSFAVVNRDMVGGVIGLANHDISARLVVDGTSDGTSDFTLPKETHNGGRNMSCVLASKNVAGGAIGSFSYSGKNFTFEMNCDDVDFSAGIYDIDVTLPQDSMIISVFGYHDEGVGGAVGTMYKIKGDSLDIRVDNYGKIITLNTSTQKSPDLHFAGGVIGFESECTVTTMNIIAYNHAGSEIGSCTATTGATSAGGVYGKLYYKVTSTVRTFNISVINEGSITARGEGRSDNSKYEGAGGCMGAVSGGGTVLLNVNTTLQSGASVAAYVNDAGGAIGYNGNNIQGSVTVTINGSTICGLTDSTNNIGGVIGRNNSGSSVSLTTVLSSDAAISGYNCVGGIIGSNNKNITGTLNSTISGTLCASGNNAGGAIGYNVANVSDSVTVTIAGSLSGIDHVGGVIGRNEKAISGTFTSNVTGSISGGQCVGGIIGSKAGENISGTYTAVVDGSISGTTYIGGAIGYNDYGVNGSVATTIGGSVTGTGNYVGGAIGYNTATFAAGITTSVNGSVSGADYVGGVIGRNDKIFSGNISSVVNGSVSGGSYVGGVLGCNDKTNNNNVNNNPSISGVMTTTVNGSINGTDCVGGVIGKNNSTVTKAFTVNIGGSVNGSINVGGCIGENAYALSVAIATEFNSSGSVNASGSKVGGVVGYNHATLNTVTSTLQSASHVAGTDDVGGAIGYNEVNINNTVTTTISGTSYVSGTNRVGGVIGNSTAGTISSALNLNISGSSYVIGHDSVGGIIGENNSTVTVALNAVLSGNVHICNDSDTRTKIGGAIGYNKGSISADISASISGRAYVAGSSDIGGVIGLNDGNVSSGISVAITCNEAVQGTSCVGSAIGRIGNSGNPTLNSVSASINGASRPIKQIGSPVDAFIGGVIGQINNGTVTNLGISGSGSAVNPSNYTEDAAVPSRIYSGSILIYGNGTYIGGLVGYMSTGGKVINISVDSLGLCVMSNNSSQCIGGCIGACDGQLGSGANSLSTYQINTVKLAYSRANYVGAFCGILGRNSTAAKCYANINMSLTGANINAISDIGGIYGAINAYIYGDMIVDINNGTTIGDYNGSVNSNGTLNTANCICTEVGGVAGWASPNAKFEGGKITVNFNGSGRIFAGGSSVEGGSVSDMQSAGVGGVFGSVGLAGQTLTGKQSLPRIGMAYNDNASYSNRASNMGDSNRYISVNSSSASPCIFTSSSNAGGVIGFMYCGRISYAYSTAVIYNGGGYSTGGFIGAMSTGHITHCYAGGHTVGGQYVSGSENIVGNTNVGGFAGFIGSETYIDFCYSTASVRGNTYVGGFVGYSNANSGFLSGYGMINTSYCTGMVAANTTESVGIYAGYVYDLDCFQNTPGLGTGGINNYALNYYNSNTNLRRIGSFRTLGLFGYTVSTSNANAYQGVIEWGRASDINRNTSYTAYAYDSYIMGGNSSVAFPYRAFIGNTHYGDWPTLQSGTTLNSSNTTISLAESSPTYTGSAIEFAEDTVTVVYNNRTLVPSSDYLITYSNNTDCGVATVTVTGINGYVGSVTSTFNIVQADINDAQIVFTDSATNNLDGISYIYNGGEEIKPEIGSITYNGIELDPNDYRVEYLNNASYGETATITISGEGNYTGSVDVLFTIIPFDFTDSVLVALEHTSYDFTDEESFTIPPEDINVTVTGTEWILVRDTDYTVSYELDTDNAIGTVVITGQGNYSGTGRATFDLIMPDTSTPEPVIDPDPDDPNNDPEAGNDQQDPDTDTQNDDQNSSGGQQNPDNQGTDG